MRQVAVSALAVVSGFAVTALAIFAVVGDWTTTAIFVGILELGPAWALSSALASSEDDFPVASRPRSWWLRVLPWTFATPLLLIPNVVILSGFIRDSRADHGRSWFSLDRMWPGDAAQDHHWPE